MIKPKIEIGDGWYLRILELDDVSEDYAAALNNKDLTRFMETGDRIYRVQDIYSYIEDNLKDNAAILFGVFDQYAKLAGTSRIHDIKKDKSSAWMGVFLFSSEIMGQGLGTKIVSLVSNYALTSLELVCIKAGIITGNDASRRCFKKACFNLHTIEPYKGRTREVWIRNG